MSLVKNIILKGAATRTYVDEVNVKYANLSFSFLIFFLIYCCYCWRVSFCLLQRSLLEFALLNLQLLFHTILIEKYLNTPT